MAERVIPRSYEWVMLVVAALIWAVLAVLFVGWWTV
jgi:nitrate reductase NapE component